MNSKYVPFFDTIIVDYCIAPINSIDKNCGYVKFHVPVHIMGEQENRVIINAVNLAPPLALVFIKTILVLVFLIVPYASLIPSVY